MNKRELSAAIAKETGLSERSASAAVKAALEIIVKTVSKGEVISLVGFGSFSRKRREARTGRNPQTGELVKIQPTNAVKFTVGAPFKAAVNKRK